jgi:thymidylate synthase
VRYANFSEAWFSELLTTYHLGTPTSPRALATKERRWVQFEVADPMSFPVRANERDFRDVIGLLEGLGIVGQFSVPELLTDRVKAFGRFEDGGVLWGAYGARVHGLLVDLVALLERDPDSRQAVLTIYDSGRDLGRPKRDVPCTLSAQLLLRDRLLDMRITMRSNDLWLGTPYDFTQFAILQASVAQALGVVPGAYHHSVGSLHLYATDDAGARAVSYRGGMPMSFPLWGGAVDDEVGADLRMGCIARRARRLAMGHENPLTPFETWAVELLRPR